MPNRLAHETSPYLLQHAHNPVDWYPWGPEALARAREENRPILLSIGYAACHWCHVMERESFEDETTAALMNAEFVNIKVDREERPDLDAIYMQATQAMTGHGGWPMTVFLTPEGVPFYAGTYFPPDDRHGMPSFRRVLAGVSASYRERPDDIARTTASVRQMYATIHGRTQRSAPLTPATLDAAAAALATQYDARHGGFGGAPKFPQTMALEFLLAHWARTGSASSLAMARDSFVHMARGGIFDQAGGGFARYAVDGQWTVPHFEKMLYDNALLIRLGAHLWQATGDDEIRRATEATMQWLRREMQHPAGGFHSSLDADSEGEEGRFYVWSDAELRDVLGDDADAGVAYWGVSGAGNFEGANILTVAQPDAADPDTVARLAARLYDVRAKRVWPARDDKVLASWNGLAIVAMTEAAIAFGSAEDRAAALRAGEFAWEHLVRDGRVLRSWKDGDARIPGFLEDHAALGLAALAMHALTFDRRWLDRGIAMAATMVDHFWSDGAAAFFDTAHDHEELVSRPRDVSDNATPSGTSLAVDLLLRVGSLTGDADALRRAGHVLETHAEMMARHPLAFGHLLTAADMLVFGAIELALVGDAGAEGFANLAAARSDVFIPSLVTAGGRPEDMAGIALFTDRPAQGGRPTAYVCRGFVCDVPAVEAGALREQLRGAARVTSS